MRDMATVLDRMKGLTNDLALAADDRPRRATLLTCIAGEMTNWPSVCGQAHSLSNELLAWNLSY